MLTAEKQWEKVANAKDKEGMKLWDDGGPYPDISYEEYRDLTYAKLKKESLEEEIKPRSKESLRFYW